MLSTQVPPFLMRYTYPEIVLSYGIEHTFVNSLQIIFFASLWKPEQYYSYYYSILTKITTL